MALNRLTGATVALGAAQVGANMAGGATGLISAGAAASGGAGVASIPWASFGLAMSKLTVVVGLATIGLTALWSGLSRGWSNLSQSDRDRISGGASRVGGAIAAGINAPGKLLGMMQGLAEAEAALVVNLFDRNFKGGFKQFFAEVKEAWTGKAGGAGANPSEMYSLGSKFKFSELSDVAAQSASQKTGVLDTLKAIEKNTRGKGKEGDAMYGGKGTTHPLVAK